MDPYGKIRAVDLTPAAPGAPARIDLGRGAFLVQSDAFPRAKSCTDAAGFAPVSKNIYLEAFPVLRRIPGYSPFFLFGLARAPALAPLSPFARLLIAFHRSSGRKLFVTAYIYKRKSRV